MTRANAEMALVALAGHPDLLFATIVPANSLSGKIMDFPDGAVVDTIVGLNPERVVLPIHPG